MIDNRLIPVFNRLNFTDWYRLLCENRTENTFENYTNETIVEIIEKLGFNVKYNKNENFFKYQFKSDGIETQLNISLKYGIIELILGIVFNGKRIKVGGPFGFIYKSLNNGERIKPANFNNYEELELILEQVFSFIDKFNQELKIELYER